MYLKSFLLSKKYHYLIEMSIKYRHGTCIKPRRPGHKYIIHPLPTKQMWGGQFLNDLADEYPEAKTEYCKERYHKLGTFQIVEIDDEITIVNMIVSQIPTPKSKPPVRYETLSTVLREIAELALKEEATIHMGRICCDNFHKGDWNEIEPILKKISEECGTVWYVYE